MTRVRERKDGEREGEGEGMREEEIWMTRERGYSPPGGERKWGRQ